MKTVLFIPGFEEDIDSRDYRATMDAMIKAGYKVEFVDITWRRTTIAHWVAEFNETYNNHDPEQTILAGFSFGAWIAYAVSLERSPAATWLFSLSPYFKEDQSQQLFKPSWAKRIGHRRADSFKAVSFVETVKTFKVPTLFFYGEEELKTWTDISYRHSATEKLQNMKTIMVPGAGHDVTDARYVAAVDAAIK